MEDLDGGVENLDTIVDELHWLRAKSGQISFGELATRIAQRADGQVRSAEVTLPPPFAAARGFVLWGRQVSASNQTIG